MYFFSEFRAPPKHHVSKTYVKPLENYLYYLCQTCLQALNSIIKSLASSHEFFGRKKILFDFFWNKFPLHRLSSKLSEFWWTPSCIYLLRNMWIFFFRNISDQYYKNIKYKWLGIWNRSLIFIAILLVRLLIIHKLLVLG